jgi:hypothetical protein
LIDLTSSCGGDGCLTTAIAEKLHVSVCEGFVDEAVEEVVEAALGQSKPPGGREKFSQKIDEFNRNLRWIVEQLVADIRWRGQSWDHNDDSKRKPKDDKSQEAEKIAANQRKVRLVSHVGLEIGFLHKLFRVHDDLNVHSQCDDKWHDEVQWWIACGDWEWVWRFQRVSFGFSPSSSDILLLNSFVLEQYVKNSFEYLRIVAMTATIHVSSTTVVIFARLPNQFDSTRNNLMKFSIDVSCVGEKKNHVQVISIRQFGDNSLLTCQKVVENCEKLENLLTVKVKTLTNVTVEIKNDWNLQTDKGGKSSFEFIASNETIETGKTHPDTTRSAKAMFTSKLLADSKMKKNEWNWWIGNQKVMKLITVHGWGNSIRGLENWFHDGLPGENWDLNDNEAWVVRTWRELILEFVENWVWESCVIEGRENSLLGGFG